MSEQVLVEVNGLVQKYFFKTVLNEVYLQVSAGECLGIFGLRGSGKTSLLQIIAGVDRFTSGTVKVLGYDIKKSQQFKQGIGLVTQEPSLFQDLSVMENLDYIAALKSAGQPDIERVITLMELKDSLRYPVTSLDAGLYQRLSLACALLNNPHVLVVDELIKDIDLYSRHLIIKQLKPFLKNGGACICGFSNIEMLVHTDRTAWLDNGKLDFYEPSALRDKWNAMLDSFQEPGDS